MATLPENLGLDLSNILIVYPMVYWSVTQTIRHYQLKWVNMHKKLNPEHHQRRARLHLWQDGIFEILIGIGTVLFSGIPVILPIIGKSTSAQIVVEVVLTGILFLIGFIVFRQVNENAKAYITYPRSGFIRLRQAQKEISPLRFFLYLALCVPVSVVLGVGLTLALTYGMTALGIDMSLFILSGLLALSVVIVARRNQQRRLYGLAFGILVIGAGLSVFGPRGDDAMTLLFLLTGLLTILSGCWALWCYLQCYPLQNLITEEFSHGGF